MKKFSIKCKNSKFLIIYISFVMLTGCVSFTKDAGFSQVASMVETRSSQTPIMFPSEESLARNQKHIQSMLNVPLKADNAVRIALLNNAGLQASLTELRISEADLVQAGKLPNPSLSYIRLSPVEDEFNIERTILFDVIGFLTIPLKTEIECRRFQQAKLQAAIDVLQLAAETRKAYYNALAAKHMVSYLEQVKEAAEASSELAHRMAQVGNFSKLQYAREQAFYAEVMSQLAGAKLTAFQEREHLTSLMGLWGDQIEFNLPEKLPDLPKIAKDCSEIEKQALISRLDIQAMKNDIAAKAKALGLTKATRFINVLELGYAHNTGQERPRQRGYEINLEVPLFDWGDARVAKSKAIYMQSVWHLRDMAIQARSEVREAYQTYRTTFDIARHYRDEVVPLRKLILDENLLRYNGMLVSTFELLADAREYMASTNTYIEALRDFWLAETDLQTAQMVKSPHS